ncbi:MAG TPA: hypothetical protein VK851_13260 [Anaerolineales bacterium]|nr:hypothetical protein [Anaerolineales bacterium]
MRRTLIILGIVVVSLILAFPLRDAVFAAIIVPAAYVFWLLGLVYRSVHQSLWWSIASILVLFIVLRGLVPQTRRKKRPPPEIENATGQIETLADAMEKADRGVYYKWMIANRIGRIAHQILSQRETGRERALFDPLAGPDWNPNAGVRSYLEAGLQGSFADYPQKNRYISQTISTPMDHDMQEVIEYLEKQVDNK